MTSRPNRCGFRMCARVSGCWLLLLVPLLVVAPRAECLCHGAQESRVAEVSEYSPVAAPIRFVGQNPESGGVVRKRSGIVFGFAHRCCGPEQRSRQV